MLSDPHVGITDAVALVVLEQLHHFLLCTGFSGFQHQGLQRFRDASEEEEELPLKHQNPIELGSPASIHFSHILSCDNRESRFDSLCPPSQPWGGLPDGVYQGIQYEAVHKRLSY